MDCQSPAPRDAFAQPLQAVVPTRDRMFNTEPTEDIIIQTTTPSRQQLKGGNHYLGLEFKKNCSPPWHRNGMVAPL